MFADFVAEQATCSRFYIVNHVIDDRVISDLDTLLVGGGTGRRIGTDVETDNRCVRRFGQTDVSVGDGTNARMQNPYTNFVIADFFHRLKNRFG